MSALQIAKESNLNYAVLYASKDGQQLYIEGMGFEISQVL